MQKKLFALSLGIAGYLLAAYNLQAQQAQCGDRAAIVEVLGSRFGETRQGIGLAEENGVVEIFASDETGTWTILFTSPQGQTCLVASGEHFESSEELAPPVGERA